MLERVENSLPYFAILYAPLTLISISLAEIVLFTGIILYLFLISKGKYRFEYPKFFIPLIFYAGFSIISSFFSYLPLRSLFSLKELFLFLAVPFVFSVLKSEKDKIEKVNSYFFYTVLLSFLLSLFQFVYFILKKSPSPRSFGFESHYMTQAGIMMILAIYSITYILEKGKESDYKIFGIFALSTLSLLLTLTRSAWLGLIVAGAILVFRKKPILIFAGIFAIIIVFLIAPAPLKNRILSFTNMKDITFQNRIIMIKKGIRMIKDKPLWGIGPGMVKYAYTVPRFKVEEKEELHSHLHNNFIQIWAERGAFTVLSWLFFVAILFYSLIKLKPDSKFFIIARESAIYIFIAFLIAGMFEFNFGDSEVLMVLFWFLTVPFLEGETIKPDK